jgi:uncharacterized protein HemY
VRLAEAAVRLTEGNEICRNTLGVAYYRAGRYREAVEALRANLKGHEDRMLAYDLYFLAMGLHRLGEPARARDYYDCAVHWTEASPDIDAVHLAELTAIRAEAEELLGIPQEHD